MVTNNLTIEKFRLDLALDRTGESQSARYTPLTNQEYWHNHLKGWLEYIRINNQYFCPSLVRRCDYLSLGLQFTDDQIIASINKKWLQKYQPTDVLSFPLIDDNSALPPQNHYLELGDIIISVETAKQQAIENHHSFGKELCWLVSHGLLHLLGWDHQTETTLNDMLNFQEKLLTITDNLWTIDIKGDES